jgi:hypothetical protein
MPRKVIEYLIAVGLLGGCAAPTWHHLSKGQADFNQDRYACIQQSAQAYPAVLQQQAIGVGSAAPSQTNCTSYFYGQVNCTTTPGIYRPPPTYTMDQNAGSRGAAFNACMASAGWWLQVDDRRPPPSQATGEDRQTMGRGAAPVFCVANSLKVGDSFNNSGRTLRVNKVRYDDASECISQPLGRRMLVEANAMP